MAEKRIFICEMCGHEEVAEAQPPGWSHYVLDAPNYKQNRRLICGRCFSMIEEIVKLPEKELKMLFKQKELAEEAASLRESLAHRNTQIEHLEDSLVQARKETAEEREKTETMRKKLAENFSRMAGEMEGNLLPGPRRKRG
jgi:DNA anti-recombination protein RmuC